MAKCCRGVLCCWSSPQPACSFGRTEKALANSEAIGTGRSRQVQVVRRCKLVSERVTGSRRMSTSLRRLLPPAFGFACWAGGPGAEQALSVRLWPDPLDRLRLPAPLRARLAGNRAPDRSLAPSRTPSHPRTGPSKHPIRRAAQHPLLPSTARLAHTGSRWSNPRPGVRTFGLLALSVVVVVVARRAADCGGWGVLRGVALTGPAGCRQRGAGRVSGFG